MCGPLCGPRVLSVEVMWQDGLIMDFFEGVVADYSEATEMHLVKYDDGDSQWHRLLDEETLGTLNWIDDPPSHKLQLHDDSVPHYIVYNADTRVLNMYPDVMVLEDIDVEKPGEFAKKLVCEPHFLHVPTDPTLVRQVFVKVTEPCCVNVPHSCNAALQKHVCR